jgi:hypothetical protein
VASSAPSGSPIMAAIITALRLTRSDSSDNLCQLGIHVQHQLKGQRESLCKILHYVSF